MKGFARGLALRKRHKTIRKWPISEANKFFNFSFKVVSNWVSKVFAFALFFDLLRTVTG